MNNFQIGMMAVDILIFLIILYFLPTIIVFINNGSFKGSTFLINLFLGWSFIGWIIAIVLAFKKEDKQIIINNYIREENNNLKKNEENQKLDKEKEDFIKYGRK